MEFQPEYEKDLRDEIDIKSAINRINSLMTNLSEQDQCFLCPHSESVNDQIIDQAETLRWEMKELGHEDQKATKENMKDDSTKLLRNQIDTLCEDWKAMRDTWEVEALQGRVGLIAVYVEQAICSHVLPEIFMNDAGASLHRLLDFLNGDDKRLPLDPNEYKYNKILREARERWEIVCKNFDFPNEWKTKTGGWSVSDCTVPGDIRAIEVLKLSGVSANYPKRVFLKDIEQNVESIKGEMPPWQYDLVAPFIGSLRGKMMKSKLHHDQLSLH